MINDLVTALRDSAVERVKNPFIGAVFIAWITVNWRIVATLILGDAPIDERISKVEVLSADYVRTLVLPLSLGLSYVVLFPWVFLWLDRLQRLPMQSRRIDRYRACLLYTSPSPRDLSTSRMPSSA